MCELPLKKPFVKTTAAVIYARAKSHLCVTLDYMQELGKTDPMAVSDGTVCGDKKVSKGPLRCSGGCVRQERARF